MKATERLCMSTQKDLATWSTPCGLSASKKDNIMDRAQHYRFFIPHHLGDGTRIIPRISTVFSVIQAFDTFGDDVPVAVSEGSYDVPTESQLEEISQINN